jgi:ribosome-associated heat shock protein Hsp15
LSGREENTSRKSSRRLDQWLWFARFVKSRSLAARLCAAGAVVVNGSAVVKANHGVRPGDVVTLSQGSWQRTVEVVALGARRGPATDAQTLFRETACVRRADPVPGWEPMLFVDDDD